MCFEEDHKELRIISRPLLPLRGAPIRTLPGDSSARERGGADIPAQVGIIFFCWFFPHTWKKGQRKEVEALGPQGEDRERRRLAARAIVDRALRVERGETVEDAPPAYELMPVRGGPPAY